MPIYSDDPEEEYRIEKEIDDQMENKEEKSKMKELNFSKNYDKLNMPQGSAITSFRGKTFPKTRKLEANDLVDIVLKGEKVRKAIVCWIGYYKIKEINDYYLRRDISPEPFNGRQDFVKVIDKHWRWIKVTEETEVSFIQLILMDHPTLSFQKYNAINWHGLSSEVKEDIVKQLKSLSNNKQRENTFSIGKLAEIGLCLNCGKKLTGRQRKSCSELCSDLFLGRFHWRQVRINVWNREKGLCQDCKGFLDFKQTYDVDHIERVTDGGGIFDMDNYQLLCPKCHKKKSKNDYKLRTTEQLKEQGQTFLDDYLETIQEAN